MPPKGKKTAKGAEDDEGGDLGVEEKLVKAQLEIESLQRELGKFWMDMGMDGAYLADIHQLLLVR